MNGKITGKERDALLIGFADVAAYMGFTGYHYGEDSNSGQTMLRLSDTLQLLFITNEGKV